MSSSPKLKFRKKIRQRDGIVLQDLANEITLDVKPKRGNRNSNFNTSQLEEGNNVNFIHIQDDVWFQIANYIDPEDVGTFALICNQTAHVVSCAIFWKNLYRRFCKDTKSLPDNLRSRCESQIGSIRSNVICALFHLYPPFIDRLKKGYEMSSVHGYRCLNRWYKKTGPFWFFYYKLWNKTKSRKPKELLDDGLEDDDEYGLDVILNKLNNVFENPEEGMYLLLVITNKFIPLPEHQDTAMILHSTRQLLNSDLRNTNVELSFLPENKQLAGISSDILYAACKHKVLPWWHPDYEKVQLLNSYKTHIF